MSDGAFEFSPLSARARRPSRVVVLTGAGISVAAGLPTYRGRGGLWEEDPGLARELAAGVDLERLWAGVAPMKSRVLAAAPTLAHRALTDFDARLRARGGGLTVITQNVDGLHQRAGTRDVIEYHGSLLRSRCGARRCDLEPFEDLSVPASQPACPRCGVRLRPDVVLFGEDIGVREETAAKRALAAADLFIAVGTSGLVWPAASFVRGAAYAGAWTIDINLVAIDDSPYDETILGEADAILPRLFAE